MEIINDEIRMLIDREVYNEGVLHKCFYWYTSNFSVSISIYSETKFLVVLQPKIINSDLPSILEKIKSDLIDFKLRDIVTKETKVIRELLVAKAFAYYGLDENPTADVSDPVGFDPNLVNQINR